MKLFFTWGLAVFALFVGLGCERVSLEDQIVVSEGSAQDVVDTGGNRYRISRVEAYGALELMLRSIDGAMTRGGQPLRLIGVSAEDLQVAQGEKTRGEMAIDTLLYYVNLAGGNGYAILPADRRVGELPLVVTEQGDITAEDFITTANDFQSTVGVQGFGDSGADSIVVDNISEDLTKDVAHCAMRYASCMSKPISAGYWKDEQPEYPSGVHYWYGPWEWGKTVGPHLSTKWTQGTPFNDWCPIKSDGYGHSRKAPAGCVTIAVAQILAYHGWPNDRRWWGERMDWDVVRTVYSRNNKDIAGSEEAQRQAAALAREVGNWLNVSYGYDGSGTTDFMAKWYLKHLGYGSVERHCGVDESMISHLADAGRIVYVSGRGHAWLIDGYIETKRTRTYYENGKECCDTEYGRIRVHCNFGWKGIADGYYFPGIFNTTQGPEKRDEFDSNSGKGQRDYNRGIHTITYW